MNEIPPFAKILINRKSADNSPVRKHTSKHKPSLRKSYNFANSSIITNSTDDEIRYLREENEHLRELVESHNSNFESLQRSFYTIQQQLNEERASSQEFVTMVTNLRASLVSEQEKNGSLEAQVKQLDDFLRDRNSVNESRKEITERLQREYNELLSDYHQTVDNFTAQSKELRAARVRVKELEDQLQATSRAITERGNTFQVNDFDGFNTAPVAADRQMPYERPFPQTDFNFNRTEPQNDFGFNRSPRYDYNYNRSPQKDFDYAPFEAERPSPRRENGWPSPSFEAPPETPKRLNSVSVGDYSPLRQNKKSVAPFALSTNDNDDRDNYNPIPQQKAVPAALNDSIRFGDDDYDDQQMQGGFNNDYEIENLKKELDQLCSQKDFIESMINSPPPRGMSYSEVEAEKKQWEEKFNVIMKRISAIRFKLRQMREI